jgi:pSer/pThr/pTyr-binding forkhead associated (FHA) protein
VSEEPAVTTIYCNKCGHQNPPGSNFCSSCGAPLEVARDDRTIVFHHVDALQESSAPDDDVVVNLNELPQDSGVLLVRSGPQAGLRLPLDQDVTSLGRHPDSDVLLDDITVSRRHAEIVRMADGGYLVRDVGSLNGTYVNRERVDERHLAHGDEVQVGKFKMVYLTGPDAA